MVSIVVMALVSAVALLGGVILGCTLGLGRQDDLMHALALLVANPNDPKRLEHARAVLHG
ncbi:MAG: hypothetical protein BWY63_01946 [Chloroflexi bacterium ADurb.Bin360]|nr:MAG: hypothetical protein BWY63_01946 [Chloroflexi bacterium ADurb.Bin360]